MSDVGYPFRALYPFDPDLTSQATAVPMKAGDYGKVLAQDGRNLWVEVSIGHTGTRGWVPRNFIEVGKTRKFGDIHVKHDIPLAKHAGFNTNDFDFEPENDAEEAIVALLAALKKHQSKLSFMKDDVRRILNSDKRRQKFVRDLTKGLHPTYVQALNKEDSTMKDVEKIKAAKVGNQTTGFYLRITSDFIDEPDREPEGYTGHTAQGFWTRKRGHVRESRRYVGRNASLRSARDAVDLHLRPICQMSCKDTDALLLGEQILMLVNGTYKSEFYDHEFSAHLDDEDTPDVAIQDIIKAVTHKETAVVLISIAKVAFETVGFVPLFRRKGFRGNACLNHSSPLTEVHTYERTLWIKLTQPGVKEVYYRSGLTLNNPQGNTYRVSFMSMVRYGPGHAINMVRMNFPLKEPHPPAGTIIYPVWELMLNGPHHTPWARLNDVGIHSDWEHANRLGLRVEWEESPGVWKYMFQQAGNVMDFEKTHDRGCLSTYTIATAVIRYLRQLRHSSPRKWDFDAGIARVKELTFDNFTQTVHLYDLGEPEEMYGAVEEKSDDLLRREMRAAGCLNVGNVWGIRSWRDDTPKSSSGAADSKICDACYIFRNYKGFTLISSQKALKVDCVPRKDVSGNDTNICDTCYHRGLLCSWTKKEDITQEMLQALSFRELKQRDIKTGRARDLYTQEEDEEEAGDADESDESDELVDEDEDNESDELVGEDEDDESDEVE